MKPRYSLLFPMLIGLGATGCLAHQSLQPDPIEEAERKKFEEVVKRSQEIWRAMLSKPAPKPTLEQCSQFAEEAPEHIRKIEKESAYGNVEPYTSAFGSMSENCGYPLGYHPLGYFKTSRGEPVTKDFLEERERDGYAADAQQMIEEILNITAEEAQSSIGRERRGAGNVCQMGLDLFWMLQGASRRPLSRFRIQGEEVNAGVVQGQLQACYTKAADLCYAKAQEIYARARTLEGKFVISEDDEVRALNYTECWRHYQGGIKDEVHHFEGFDFK